MVKSGLVQIDEIAMASNTVENPADISFETVVVDISLHPNRDVVASGNIEGEIAVHSYSLTEKNHHLMSLAPHKKSCRAVQFSPGGQKLISASKDKSICCIDMEKGSVSQKLKKTHESPIYSLLVVDDNMIATGDDDGHLKIWDLRQNKSVMEINENDDFISDMVVDNTNRYLLATSGDGTLTSYDIRKHKMKMQSELFDSEMLSLALVKGDEKVVVGTGEGVLNIFNWGEWGNISDRFPGHPMSIDCIVPFNDNLIFTGSFDGMIRAVHVLPNEIVGVLGEHKDFPVENLSLSHCRKFIASCSHDQTVKFWNIENVEKEKVETHKRKKKGKNNKPKMLNTSAKKDDFFSDLGASEEPVNSKSDSEDDSGDSDEEEEGNTKSSSKPDEKVTESNSPKKESDSNDSSFDEDDIDSDDDLEVLENDDAKDGNDDSDDSNESSESDD